ncbi:hypothetical protein CH380_10585 [Leptospira adleri]|uniref:Uncharacterized protein n=1 Tax=Leptospira adleri TaxID=2023186 RepID=A0A2M9YNY5_9LEPT|nr:hypothetical protein CH380_10585 [Leptospira adleri]PJZ63944.1 hypothetical protein CH376_00525 [Leptospira adleri]
MGGGKPRVTLLYQKMRFFTSKILSEFLSELLQKNHFESCWFQLVFSKPIFLRLSYFPDLKVRYSRFLENILLR